MSALIRDLTILAREAVHVAFDFVEIVANYYAPTHQHHGNVHMTVGADTETVRADISDTLAAVTEEYVEHRKARTEEIEADINHPWVKWATVAIQEQWREHVSPLIADHLNRARLARNANESFQLGRQWMETGQDMGASMARELFPQHTKRT